MLLPSFVLLLAQLCFVLAATTDEWRSRSIYQLITDRFAPATANAPCNTADRVYCGGTWQTTISQLDYIQGMGFDAIWISPTHLQLDYETIYGWAYHGYWPADQTKLNPHFGAESDLKALSDALHQRGMYLMVDLAINDVVSTSTNISDAALATYDNGTLLFKQESDFHPACPMQSGNRTSEMTCWLSDSGVTLMDLAVETSAVGDVFINWVPGYVSTYGIDGFRIDMTKHMSLDFQHNFCDAAGIFCIGEVADTPSYAATFQGLSGIDSVWSFGMMWGFQAGFGGKPSISQFVNELDQLSLYPDATVIGTFLDNQDNPRFNSLTSDASLVYNAIAGCFLINGIPTVYYGLEQDIGDGSADPYNREALWLYNDFSTTATPTYGRITRLNAIRSYLGSVSNFHMLVASISATQNNDIAMQRGDLLLVLTNRGASGTGSWKITNTTLGATEAVIDLLSCTNYTTGSDKSLTVTWTTGQPFAFVPVSVASGSSLCGFTGTNATSTSTPSTNTSSSSSSVSSSSSSISTSAAPTSITASTSSSSTSSTSAPGSSASTSSFSILSGVSTSSASPISTFSKVASSSGSVASGGGGGSGGGAFIGQSVSSSSSLSSSSSSPVATSSGTTGSGEGTGTGSSGNTVPSGNSGWSGNTGSSVSSAAGGSSTCNRRRKRLEHRAVQ